MATVLAKWWEPIEGSKKNKVLCTLCPRYCKIGDGQAGFCYIRRNRGGKLYQDGYGTSTGFAVDPIEKKPLNHFLPGSPVLSFGTAGCNLGCRFCQNWDISKAKLDEVRSLEMTAEGVVKLAMDKNCPSIAYTYNDPTIWGEWVMDIARVAREVGIKNVMVTAGYITPEAREEIYPLIDAANVDLKAFTDTFYHKLTFSHLAEVLDTISWLVNETDVWTEITNLIIPGHNDSMNEINEMVDWILENVGDEVPTHFTAFHPDFKMIDTPPTPPETLTKARNLAMRKGLKYVYVGNVHDITGQTTYCPNCNKSLIVRNWHSIINLGIVGDKCDCGQTIPIIWN
ncbi:MAG: AmmeMemoRadiSam system radical SAM enzyme [Candidatus Marinimicrobia bacterium]|nr:AmmeMemoRadiSam system radical SAM enzyme [Candidatus Neomarinimicrobiota bacterium]